jgi:hypothetical protein
MLENINININRDDVTVNDYLFCTSMFGQIPNRISIFSNYDFKQFIEFLNQTSVDVSTSKEIIHNGEECVTNEKRFVKIGNIYVSFVEYDKSSDFAEITDVVIYYNSESIAETDAFLESINKFVIDYRNVGVEQKFNITTVTSEGLQLEPLEILNGDYENIHLYHNQETFKRSTKLIKSINKTKKGLSIIFGERGLGKTTLMNYITSNIDRLCIFIPSNMIDVVNTNDFKNLIRKNRNSLIVIDDCEIYFSNNFTKSNLLTNNILHMVDGITSDMDNMQIIIVLNTDSIHDIDPILLDCNNLIDVIEVERLSDSAADGLCKHLHLKNKSKNKRLVDILKKRKVEEDIIKMGFH